MSMFLLHQDNERTIMLADSLAIRKHADGSGSFPITASKLAFVAPGIYAAHAGTWQPAWAMLSELREFLEPRGTSAIAWEQFCHKLSEIGAKHFEDFTAKFGTSDFDVRIALVLTDQYREAQDQAEGFTSTIILWEAARKFIPHKVRGRLYFGGSLPLSELATRVLNEPVLKSMLDSTPFSAAQALLATHSLLSRISTSISSEVNVLLVAGQAEHTILHGSVLQLPCDPLIAG